MKIVLILINLLVFCIGVYLCEYVLKLHHNIWLTGMVTGCCLCLTIPRIIN